MIEISVVNNDNKHASLLMFSIFLSNSNVNCLYLVKDDNSDYSFKWMNPNC